MTTKAIREQFEIATGYQNLPESAKATLDSNDWATWCLAWQRMKSAVEEELRWKVQGLLAITESECDHLTNNGHSSSARVLRKEITLMTEYLDSLES